IEVDPDRLEPYGLLSALYVHERRLGEATTSLQQIVEQNPSSGPARTALGTVFQTQGKMAGAEEQDPKVLQLDRHAVVAPNNPAWMLASTNRNLEEALQLAQEAQKQASDEPHVADTLGWIYYRKNLATTAIPYLEASVRKDPSDPASHYHLGMAYVETGNF